LGSKLEAEVDLASESDNEFEVLKQLDNDPEG
jgi:hypothetical protein